jgi:hypothetical protein
MKAFSLTLPWALLVVIGAKRIETRSWRVWIHGRVAIHASKGFPKAEQELCYEEPFRSVLAAHFGSPQFMPHLMMLAGNVLGEVDITGCLGTETIKHQAKYFNLTEQEEAFGDFGANRYGIFMEKPELYKVPVPAKGSLGFWEWKK